MAENPYKGWTVAKLEAKQQKLMADKAKIRADQLLLGEAFDEAAAAEKVAKLAETLSDPEKAALAQVIKPKGIESAEKVGTPGAS